MTCPPLQCTVCAMSSKKLVAKKNILVPEFVKLRHQEKRFLAYCIAELNPKKDAALGRFTVNIGNIADVFGLSKTSTYPRIKEAATAINSRPIIRKDAKKTQMDFWFSWLDYEEDSGNVEIQFNERLVPFLLDLKREYIQYPLSMVVDFSNRTWSLYEIIKQWVRAGKKHFTLDELKELLGVVGKYPKWADFKKRCLTPAIEEINAKSDIQTKYEVQKQGRRIVGLVFFIDIKQTDEVITVESKQDVLFKSLFAYGINKKTVDDYTQIIEREDKIELILEKLPRMARNAKSKQVPLAKYIIGAIKQELYQGKIYENLPEPPAHKEALDCWTTKRHNNEKCKVRRRGKPGQRKKCQICFDQLPIDTFGI